MDDGLNALWIKLFLFSKTNSCSVIVDSPLPLSFFYFFVRSDWVMVPFLLLR